MSRNLVASMIAANIEIAYDDVDQVDSIRLQLQSQPTPTCIVTLKDPHIRIHIGLIVAAYLWSERQNEKVGLPV
jgi:hypothetical protein